jgi:hypothetical protein
MIPSSSMQGSDWIFSGWSSCHMLRRANGANYGHFTWRSGKEGDLRVTGASAMVT